MIAPTVQGQALLLLAHLAVLRALELAGKRMLVTGLRGAFRDIPAHELHTVLPRCLDSQFDKLLADAWIHLDQVLPDHQADAIACRLDDYVRVLLRTRTVHRIDDLPAVLKEATNGRVRERAISWD